MSQDLLTQLAEYGNYCDEQQGSVSADDVIDVVVPLPMPAPPAAPRRGWLVAVAAAAVILIVIGGMAWLTSFSDSIAPTDEPTQTTDPETTVPTTPDTTTPPTTLPAGPVEVTVEWTEYGATPPADPIRIVSPRPGFATITKDSSGMRLWTSDDGLNWRASAGPQMDSESASLHSTASGLWLSGQGSLDWLTKDDPLELWHTTDLVGWERVELGESIHAPYGLWWETSIDDVASVGNATIVSLQLSLEFDWAAILGIEAGRYDDFPIVEFDETRTDETDVYAVTRLIIDDEEDSEQLVAEIRFVSDQDGLLLLDNTTGDEIIFFPRGIEGAGRDTTDDPLFALHEGGWGSSREVLLLVRPDGARTIDPEIGASAPFEYCWQTLTEVDGQVLVAVCDEDGAAETFLTSDGVTWSDGPPIPPLASRDYDPDSGYWYGSTIAFDGSTLWISSSGADWTMLNPPADQYSRLFRLAGGWVVTDSSGDVFVSSDGEFWSTSADGPSDLRMLALGNWLVGFDEETTWVGVVTFD